MRGLFDNFPLAPEQASTMAARVDANFFGLLLITGGMALLVCTLIIFFAVRYRRTAKRNREIRSDARSQQIEIAWSVTPLFIFMGLFAWAGSTYFQMYRPPSNAMTIYVVGRQWMWKLQHMDGQREINQLHVPVNTPVKLLMTSEDVIHSFGVPAFRMKQDVLPERYTMTWFEATRPGIYHLFCSEYCGTLHSQMTGSVIVMDGPQYERWSSEHGENGSLASQGKKLVSTLGCVSCHRPDATGRAPNFEGLYGATVRLKDGRAVVADENYLRESILAPTAKVAAGYDPIMPTYKGQVNEEQVLAVIAYIRSLSEKNGGEYSPYPLNEEKIRQKQEEARR